MEHAMLFPLFHPFPPPQSLFRSMSILTFVTKKERERRKEIIETSTLFLSSLLPLSLSPSMTPSHTFSLHLPSPPDITVNRERERERERELWVNNHTEGDWDALSLSLIIVPVPCLFFFLFHIILLASLCFSAHHLLLTFVLHPLLALHNKQDRTESLWNK